MEERYSFQNMALEQWDIHMQKEKNKINRGTDVISFTEINPKWVIDLNFKNQNYRGA